MRKEKYQPAASCNPRFLPRFTLHPPPRHQAVQVASCTAALCFGSAQVPRTLGRDTSVTHPQSHPQGVALHLRSLSTNGNRGPCTKTVGVTLSGTTRYRPFSPSHPPPPPSLPPSTPTPNR